MITSKILQCGKSFKSMQIRGDIFRTRVCTCESTQPWNWGVTLAQLSQFANLAWSWNISVRVSGMRDTVISPWSACC